MSVLESKAVFLGRARHMGVSESTIEAMERKNWATLASFAFSSSYVPGSGDDRSFKEQVLVPLLGSADHVESSALRRLLFESYTLSAAELRGRLERQVDDTPRRLPAVERHERYKKLQAALPHLEMTGPYEPANALVDIFADFLETGSVKYVAWSECVSREDEVNLMRKQSSFKKEPHTGFIKMVDDPRMPEADTATDLKIMQALTRRGLAMQMAGILSFLKHDAMVRIMLKEYQRTQPESYNQLSYINLERADREVFRRLAEECRAGLQPDSYGRLPMDVGIDKIVMEVGFRMLLVPTMRVGNSGRKQLKDDAHNDAPGKTKSALKRERMTAKLEKKLRAKSVEKDMKPKAGFKKEDRQSTPMPKALIGMSSKTPEGKRLCFAFNLGTCKTQGPRCERGEHLCCLDFEPHSYTTHK